MKHSSANNLPDLQEVLDQSNQLCDQVLLARSAYDPVS